MNDFVPVRWLAGGHRMTIYAGLRRRVFPDLPPPEDRLFDVPPDTRLLARCHWQRRPADHPTLVILHGLEGSADAHYVRGLSDKAWRRGFNIVRLNQRNCGRTEHLSPTLYHSGLSGDPRAVLEELAARDRLPRIGIVGYSLGGNLALKLAGELGDAFPPVLKAVVAVSPAIDLPCCMTAIERRANRVYELNFLRGLRERLAEKARLFPDRYDAAGLARIRSIRAFDARFTAPSFGFASAEDYYVRASAGRVVDRIRVPTLILSAADDPFVPPAQFSAPEVAGNPNITTVVTRHGGHCGFVARRDGRRSHDGYWAEHAAVAFVAERSM